MPYAAATPRLFFRFRYLFVCCILIGLLGTGVNATAQQTHTLPAVTDGIFQYVPGELLVKLAQFTAFDAASRSTTSDTLNALMQSVGVTSVQPLFDFGEAAARPLDSGLAQYVKMTLSPDVDVLSLSEVFQADPSVELASPNFIGSVNLVPNDEHFPGSDGQWALNNSATAQLNVPAAWDITTGSEVDCRCRPGFRA
ncbi:MAG: hypothetical protein IPK19_38860 [Chloroflexi bacterium]|nr:hypothetical protein [Chloroflexota bacterium]